MEAFGESLNIEQEARRKAKEKQNSELQSAVQTIDSSQALFLPIGASLSLLIMFFFFDSLQTVFALFTAVIATVAFAFLLLPVCQFLTAPCSDGHKISFNFFGRYTLAEILSLFLSFTLVCLWVLTGHWLLMDALGMGLCVAFIALVRLPSLKVSTLLLSGLLIYDVVWVFFSSYMFNANVMVKVATRPAENPVYSDSFILCYISASKREILHVKVGLVFRKLHLTGFFKEPPKLSLPGKLVFPSSQSSGRFSMLGLGDVVMPGLLLCFVLRYDAYKRAQCAEQGLLQPTPAALSNLQKVTYFHCSLIGYFIGLLTATVSSEIFKAAQPALLYLVPFTLLPLFVMAHLK
uniref:Signal peptide peptidase-like 3 n=1 Tax=Romanomermis culicivorax TaxID=13658 RepID=A0A915KE19_ROMCU